MKMSKTSPQDKRKFGLAFSKELQKKRNLQNMSKEASGIKFPKQSNKDEKRVDGRSGMNPGKGEHLLYVNLSKKSIKTVKMRLHGDILVLNVSGCKLVSLDLVFATCT